MIDVTIKDKQYSFTEDELHDLIETLQDGLNEYRYTEIYKNYKCIPEDYFLLCMDCCFFNNGICQNHNETMKNICRNDHIVYKEKN